ncbi:MarR family transcriptional regulator [Candidatus Woesearchaeota archaeon]|nr:MarR family transcriptional regulator [Candidatus Woesearchaeota archaeon]
MLSQKTVGLCMMVIAVVLFTVGFIYVQNVESALLAGHQLTTSGECTHPTGAACPFQELNQLAVPKFVALLIDVVLFISGLFLFLQKKPEEKALSNARKAAKSLGGDEAKLFDIIVQANGLVFQNELVEKMALSKVKITRLLDKLEAKGLVERRRRGMTNVVVLK